jgi:hypothetical protein
MKAQKFFRYLWRINAVLILLAVGAITFGVGVLIFQEFGLKANLRRNADAGVQVAAKPKLDLVLGNAEPVAGTAVLRAHLTVSRGNAGFSSGGYSETRNILFIDPTQKAAHGLLPDNDHVVVEHSDINERDSQREKLIARAMLVKPPSDQEEFLAGHSLLVDPTGKNVVEVATDVRDLHTEVSLRRRDERNRHLVSAVFDSKSLTKKNEQEIEVPQLK